jgi:hypothetical protein
MNSQDTHYRRLKTIFKLVATIGVIVGGIVLLQYALNEEVEESIGKHFGGFAVAECHIRCTENGCKVYHDASEKKAFELSAEEEKAEKEFLNEATNNTKQLIGEYDKLPESLGGKVLNVDTARDLYDPYRKNPGEYSIATHKGAVKFIQLLRIQKFDALVTKKHGSVIYLAGGSAAGKGTAIEKFLMPLVNQSDVVLDGTFSDYHYEHSDLEKLLNNGIKVSLVYVYRPAGEATKSVIERCKQTGRMVPLSAVARSHYFSMKTVLKTLQQEGPRIHFYLVISGKTIEEMKFISNEKTDEAIEFLKSHAYTSYEDVLRQVIEAYDQTDKKGLTTDALNEFEKDAACAREALKKETAVK